MRTDAINWFASSELCRSLQDEGKTPLTLRTASTARLPSQSDLIRAAAVRMGYADPEILIKIRDEGFKRIREGVERQGSSAHCDAAISKFELMFRESPR